jgi:transcription termination factor NusB
MFKKYFLLLLFIFSFIFPLNVFAAGDLVPSKADVYFAQQFYIVFRGFMDKNENLVDNIKPQEGQTKEHIMKQYALNRLELTEDTIVLIEGIRPSTYFANVYDNLLLNLRKDADLLTEAVEMCEKGMDFNTLDEFFTARFDVVEKKYEEIKENFITRVKAWPQGYVDMVEEAYNNN